MQELEGILSRAALQSPEAAQQLPEEVFWFATQTKDRLKWNLLSPGALPWLKPFLRRCVQTLQGTFALQCVLTNWLHMFTVPQLMWGSHTHIYVPLLKH